MFKAYRICISSKHAFHAMNSVRCITFVQKMLGGWVWIATKRTIRRTELKTYFSRPSSILGFGGKHVPCISFFVCNKGASRVRADYVTFIVRSLCENSNFHQNIFYTLAVTFVQKEPWKWAFVSRPLFCVYKVHATTARCRMEHMTYVPRLHIDLELK